MQVLFVCGDYYPKPSANGVCVIRIQEALLRAGVKSDVICFGKEYITEKSNFGNIDFVDGYNFNLKKGKPNKLFLKLKILLTWPVKDKNAIELYKKVMTRKLDSVSYDLVISVLRPIEGAIACASFDNVVLLELDSITNNGDNLYGIKKLLSFRAKKIENIIYNNAIHIFHLRCHEKYYINSKYQKYFGKFEITDIPHLLDRRSEIIPQNNFIDIIYAGSMIKVRNSPDYAIDLIKEISKTTKVKCEFFSKGDCETTLIRESKMNPEVIISHGYVSQKELYNACEKADVFLSIGFHHKGSVTSIPSKIFEYMSTGKIILHIYGGENDTAIEYLNAYDNAIIIYPYEDIFQNAKKIIDFIELNRGRVSDVKLLRKKLPMNTPEWTAKRIIEIANERSINGERIHE